MSDRGHNQIEYFNKDVNINGDIVANNITTAENTLADLETIHTDTFEPNGVVDRTESTIAFDNTNRRFSITPTGSNFSFYQVATKYTKSTTETFDIADTEGLHAIVYDNGSITEYVNPTPAQFETIVFSKVFLAVILWNATDKEGLLFDERHGCIMDGQSHYYAHNAFGCRYFNGLGLTSFSLDQDGSLDAHAQFGVSAGQVADEDITHDVSSMASTDTYVVMWKNASGYWRWDTTPGFGVLTTGTGRLAYNNAGTLTEVGNNNFALYHLYGTGVSLDQGGGVWENHPLMFMGVAEYSNVSAARDAASSEISILDLTGFAYERKALYSLVFQTANGMTNTVKSALRSIDGEPTHAGVDWRTSPLNQNIASTLYHEATLERNTGDQHTQYAYSTGRSGGQSLIGGTDASDNLTLSSTSNATKGAVHLNDWAKLGTDASTPAIKTMKKTGTTGTAGGAVVSVNTGIDTDKILSFSCYVDDSTGRRIPPENSSLALSQYSVWADELVLDAGADIIFSVPSGQTAVASRPFEVFIVYEV